MLKKLLITTALSGLMVSAAMAQSQSPSSSSPTPPAASPSDSSKSMSSDPAKPSSSSMSSDKSSAIPSTTGAASASASPITAQKPDQLLVSNLKGVDVLGSDDKKVGDISDLLFTKDGKVEAILISVGGFLGVGAKEIALAPSQIQLHEENGSWKAKVSMNKDQLKDAPDFERYKSTTTGSGMGSSSKSTSAPRTAPNTTPPK